MTASLWVESIDPYLPTEIDAECPHCDGGASWESLAVMCPHCMGKGDQPDTAPARVWVPVTELPAVCSRCSGVGTFQGDPARYLSGAELNDGGYAVSVVTVTCSHDRPLRPVAVGDRVDLVTECGTCQGAGEVWRQTLGSPEADQCPSCSSMGAVPVGSATIADILPVWDGVGAEPNAPYFLSENLDGWSSARFGVRLSDVEAAS